MFSAELGMVVSRPCWFLFSLVGSPFRGNAPVALWVPRRREEGGAAWDRSRGPGYFCFGAWLVSVPETPAGRRLLGRHGGGALDFF